MTEIKREQPTQHFEIKEEEGQLVSVSVENYPFMATDGYNSTVLRKMYITPEKLEEELDKLREDIENAPVMIESAETKFEELKTDLEVVKHPDVKAFIEKGLGEREQRLKTAKLELEQDKKTLAHYEELYSRMKNGSTN